MNRKYENLNDIELLDINKKIKEIKVNKFLPGEGKKQIKNIGIASKAVIVGIISQILNIPILSDVIKTVGTATSGLISNNIVASILNHFYPVMEPNLFNKINDAANTSAFWNIDIATMLTDEEIALGKSELFQNTPRNLQLVNDALKGVGEYGWLTILVENVSAFVATHPELIIAGGTVLFSSLVVLARNIAKDIKVFYMEKNVVKKGSNLQIETLNLLKKMSENRNFYNLKHHIKFSKLTDALVYVINKVGNVSSNMLLELNSYLKEFIHKLNCGEIKDLNVEYKRLENILKGIELKTNDIIKEHNDKIKVKERR